jgi:hypothetical protein
MGTIQDLSWRELMQMFHDLEDIQKDIDMIAAFTTEEELMSILKNQKK